MSLPTNCPLCNSAQEKQFPVTKHVYGQKKGGLHSFYYCDVCDVRYLYPTLSQDDEVRFYSKEFEKFMETRSGKDGGWAKSEDHIKANEPTRVRRMKYLNPYFGTNKDILEVGCSSGFMLFPFLNKGHNCIGIEPSGIFSDYVQNQGINIYSSINDLIEARSEMLFDIIMHFFVLEHIVDPVSFLEKQMKLLKPGGKIIFEIPNVADPLYSIYDIPTFERFYWSIAHPWYFSEKSLRYLLDKLRYSYEIKLDQRYDLSNHLIWARDGRPGGMGRFTKLLGKELEDNYKNNLIDIGMCDTLIGIIHK